MIALLLLASVAAGPCERDGLTAHEAALCRYEAATTVERDVAELPAIYAQPGFERARERNSGAVQALVAQARAWLLSLFETTGAETYSNVTRVLVLVAAVAIGVFAALRLRARRATATVPRVERAATALQLDDPAAHRARAQQLLDSDPREAIREALFSLLATLERRRYARPDRTKTNRELTAELPRNGAPAALTDAVTPLLSWFDRTFYSLGRVTPDEARRFLQQIAAVTEQA